MLLVSWFFLRSSLWLFIHPCASAGELPIVDDMKRLCSVAVILVLATLAYAAPRVEKVGPFSGETTEKLKAALAKDGYRIYLPNTLVGCEIWLAASLPSGEKGRTSKETGNIYPDLGESQFLGVITFPKGGGADFRGQAIRPGAYTMRYAQLPNDGNHLGVAPNPDMVLLVPIADDPDPSVNFDLAKLVELSAKASRTAHPAVFEMMPPVAGEPSVTQTDEGWIVFHSGINKDGKPFPIAVVVKGSAVQ